MFLEQQINMISEGCDTEDWSNDSNSLHFKIYVFIDNNKLS